jgi:hypothetical protein
MHTFLKISVLICSRDTTINQSILTFVFIYLLVIFVITLLLIITYFVINDRCATDHICRREWISETADEDYCKKYGIVLNPAAFTITLVNINKYFICE